MKLANPVQGSHRDSQGGEANPPWVCDLNLKIVTRWVFSIFWSTTKVVRKFCPKFRAAFTIRKRHDREAQEYNFPRRCIFYTTIGNFVITLALKRGRSEHVRMRLQFFVFPRQEKQKSCVLLHECNSRAYMQT